MIQFAQWLSETSVSLGIQTHEWIIPTLQSIHIVAIGVIFTSVFMIALRILGFAGSDQTLLETFGRFGPPLSAALFITVATGAFQVMGEPARELLSFSFWLKMSLLATATLATLLFQRAVKRNEHQWGEMVIGRWTAKSLTILTVLIWAGIIILGRLIAYDSIWGSWSRVPKD